MSFESEDENIAASIQLADISVNSVNKTAGKPLGVKMNPNKANVLKPTKQPSSGPKPSKDGLTSQKSLALNRQSIAAPNETVEDDKEDLSTSAKE